MAVVGKSAVVGRAVEVEVTAFEAAVGDGVDVVASEDAYDEHEDVGEREDACLGEWKTEDSEYSPVERRRE